MIHIGTTSNGTAKFSTSTPNRILAPAGPQTPPGATRRLLMRGHSGHPQSLGWPHHLND